MPSAKLYTILGVLLLITWTRASPKPLSCMSYLEDERSMQDDDDDFDDDFGDTPSAAADDDLSVEDSLSVEMRMGETQVARQRLCQSDYTFCFSLWRQSGNGTHIEKQGCWKESTERNATCSQSECTSSAPTSRNNSLYYCCCSGDLCNRNVSVVEPAPLQLSKAISVAKSGGTGAAGLRDGPIWRSLFLLGSVVAVGLLGVSVVALIYCRALKEKPVPEEAPLAPSGPGYSSNLRNVDNMNLICMLGSGKYGTVMKGLLHDQEVAVKIFPEAHHQYYINERNIYSLPLMDCPALLSYFGYDERRTMDEKIEYQLVLSLASLGCLQDWLIVNSIDFETFCGMTRSITRGLSHLHTELRRGDDYKPCIAHRDLNTRNILVKADRTCCIADFGFALKVFGSKYEYKGEIAMAETKSINEVGTLRYMAPELLEGAVNLRDCETSLKQMDVYALGLVLWEVASRCADFYPPAQTVPPYKAPYELEVGSHPSFDQMQALVVRHKARPLFPAGWGGGPAAKLVKDTCEDCWDQDAEARLTSLCAEERMHEVSGLRPRIHPYTQAVSPLLSANNLGTSSVVTESVGNQRTPVSGASLEINQSSCETSTMLVPPPNQQIMPSQAQFRFSTHDTPGPVQTEKNHLIGGQQQLQPYQGRNPCQERNLAPVSNRPPQVLVEKSKKHSFQTAQENSFSCLEDDVSVEDLISSANLKKFNSMPQDQAPSLGQGFPKQQNTDKKLRGWHGVRALIQKKLFRNDAAGEMFPHYLGYGDEKSNLVDNRYAAVVKAMDGTEIATSGPHATPPKATISFIEDKPTKGVNPTTKTTTLEGVYHTQTHTRRPNNLDLSPMAASAIPAAPTVLTQPFSVNANCGKANHIGCDITGTERTRRAEPKRVDTRTCTPSHVVPRSLSTNLVKQINQPNPHNNNVHNKNNNNIHNNNYNIHTKSNCNSTSKADVQVIPTVPVSKLHAVDETSDILGEPQFRRQRSLEMFREVFSGRGSTERLRDPSQRVKTPGDVPPSVRKVRASKTLSLYDDRMMDSSALNIL